MRKSFCLLFIFLGVGAPLLLGGCMMWMHGMDHGAMEHDQGPARTVVKELSNADVTLSLYVPRLVAGKEAMLILKAERISDGAPITGARVGFVVDQEARHEGNQAAHYDSAGIEREAAETQKGVYQASYRLEAHGPYRVIARFRMGEEPVLSETVTLAVAVEAGGHESKKYTTMWMALLGGICMAAMMIVILL